MTLNCKFFSRTFGATPYHASHTRFHISSFKHSSWLPTSFFIIIQTFSMEFTFGIFPGHFRSGTLLYSRNVLSLLEFWIVTISCIKIYPSCRNTKHSHESVIYRHHNQGRCLVWSKQNEKYHAKCIETNVRSPVNVQV